jgi:low affinity Fe/Cu permease
MAQSGWLGRFFEGFSTAVTRWTGSTAAFGLACAVIITWAITGPLFHYSDTWQLVINTGTTIVTFLMVFLIQRSQNKDSLAVQLKLNELVAAMEGASNRLIDVEDLTEDELKVLHKYYERLTMMAKKDFNLTMSHSIEEAEERHSRKAARHADYWRAKHRSTDQ